jgi:hypothetical protein
MQPTDKLMLFSGHWFPVTGLESLAAFIAKQRQQYNPAQWGKNRRGAATATLL